MTTKFCHFQRLAGRKRNAIFKLASISSGLVRFVGALPEPNFPLGEIMLSVRRSNASTEAIAFREVALSFFDGAIPWRSSTYRHNQTNRPGMYWAVTEKAHVPYESLTELFALLSLDRDPDVKHILAQPFQLSLDEPRGKSYVPDFLSVRNDLSAEVVEVKPLYKLNHPEIKQTLDWAREIIEPRGWKYVIVNEPTPQVGYNLRFLAGYRRSWLFSSDVLAAVRDNTYQPEFFVALESRMTELTGMPRPMMRAHLLHLMWTGELVCELNSPLDAGSVLLPYGRPAPAERKLQ